MTDKDILEAAKEEMFKDFRVEIEDVKNPQHQVFKQEVIKPMPIQQKKLTDKEIMKFHGFSYQQFRYLKYVKKYSRKEIIEKGWELYRRPRIAL